MRRLLGIVILATASVVAAGVLVDATAARRHAGAGSASRSGSCGRSGRVAQTPAW